MLSVLIYLFSPFRFFYFGRSPSTFAFWLDLFLRFFLIPVIVWFHLLLLGWSCKVCDVTEKFIYGWMILCLLMSYLWIFTSIWEKFQIGTTNIGSWTLKNLLIQHILYSEPHCLRFSLKSNHLWVLQKGRYMYFVN